MTARTYIATEGPHDVEFVAALLRPAGFKRVKRLSELDPYWRPLVPISFPHNDDLLARVPVPTFLAAADRSIAVDPVRGDSQLADRTEEALALVRGERPAVGAILDADTTSSAQDRFQDLAESLRRLGLLVPEDPGTVALQTPHCGVFVLPDNESLGTLESLLLECAGENYAQLRSTAIEYVDRVDRSVLSSTDLKDLRKPAGRQKAIASSIAAVLRPGKAIQVSIQDNDWLRGRALELPRIARLRGFLAELLDLPQPGTAVR